MLTRNISYTLRLSLHCSAGLQKSALSTDLWNKAKEIELYEDMFGKREIESKESEKI